MHLGLAVSTWMSSRAALPLWKSGSIDWKPDLRAPAENLRQRLNGAPSNGFDAALDAEIRRRLDSFLGGIEAYRRHSYRRDLADPPVLWREGTTRLLDYGTADGGVPVFVVPSLVNRYYVLDLSARCSLIRHMAGAGLRPLVVDWDRPGAVERGFTLTDYIAGRLEAAFDAAAAATGGPVAVMGYCMGGNLALALALRRQEAVSRLALLATPWDFHADDAAGAKALAAGMTPFWPLVDALGELPIDLLQVLFSALDPYLAVKKFLAFGRLDPGSAKAAHFVALEDWLNDGVPMAAPVARECLIEWYGRSRPAAGEWRIAGTPVRPQDLDMPALAVVPAQDRIVPPASAAALADAIPGCERMTPTLGHIGMVVGGSAPEAVWAPLVDWLRCNAALA
jgi:polyhydroxyalkanoate synthase